MDTINCLVTLTFGYILQNIYFFLLNRRKKLTQIWNRAGRYDDIYRMDEIKSLSFHIMLYRLFRGVAKYIVYGTFSSFGWLREG